MTRKRRFPPDATSPQPFANADHSGTLFDNSHLGDEGLPSEVDVPPPEPQELANDAETDPSKMSPYERYMTVFTEAGFSPKSPRELNLAIGYIENRDKPGGFGKYLNEVLIHQQRAVTDDPQAALRKIVADVRSFAKSVIPDQTMIEEMQSALPDGNFTVIGDSSTVSGWKHQSDTKRGLRLIAHEHRLRQHEPDDPTLDLTPPDDDEIAAMVGSMQTFEAAKVIKSLTKQHGNRRKFWIEVLKSAQTHMVVKSIVDSALKELDRNPESPQD